MKAGSVRRLGAAGILLVCLAVLPGQASAIDPAFSVSQDPPPNGTEGGPVKFTVTFTPAAPVAYTLSYSVTHTTTSAADFSGPTSGTVSVAALAPSATIILQTAEDPFHEPNETFVLNVSKDAVGSNTAAGTIIDNDPMPRLEITGPASVPEVAGDAMYSVAITGQSASTVSVNFATADGTAVAGKDYTQTSGPLTWLSGDTSAKPIPVPILHDLLNEGNENFSVSLSNVSSSATVATGTVTTTIVDNDATPTLAITGPASVDEAAGTATYSIAITGQSAGTVSVNFATAPGSAVAPGDYTHTADSRSWPSTDTGAKTITVPIVNDTLDENDENFSVTLANPVGATITSGSVTTTIVDNDALPSATVNDIAVGEGRESTTTNAVFTVTLNAASGREVRIPWSTAPGTATEPEDYQPDRGTVVIAPGETRGTITVVVKGDNLFEPDERFSVVLVNPTNATLSKSRGEGTITNDDSPANPTVAPASVTEGNAGPQTTNLVFQVTLPGPRPQMTFTYRTVVGSATSSDYTEVGGAPLVFPAGAGATTLPITIKVNGDKLDENDESFTLELLSSTSGAVVATATGTIVDDDNTSKLSISDSTADEPRAGTATMKFTVTLLPASARAVSVNWATADGTATAGVDYTAGSGALSFAPGETSKEIVVSVTGDELNEENETVLVKLSGPAGAGFAAGGDQGQGTIIDRNAPPSLSISDTVAREGGSGAEFTVTLAGTTLRTVTVRFSTGDGTATAAADYVARVGTLTFAPGEKTKAIAVTVIDDTAAETAEDFYVQLGDAVNGTITKSLGAATIEASDQAPTTPKPPPPGPDAKIVVKKTTLLPQMLLGPRTVTIGAAGVARMLVTCAKASPITCSGSVALETVAKPKFQLGKKTFSVKKGTKVYVSIRLSARSIKQLKLKGTLQATAIVIVKTSAKSLRVVPGVITLKLKPGTKFKVQVSTPPTKVFIDSP